MAIVIVDQDAQIAMDAVTGAVAEWREDVVTLDVMPLYEEVERLEEYVNDMMRAMDPSTTTWGTLPGREGAHGTAGFLTNFTHGFVIGAMLIALVAFTLAAMYKLHAFRMLGI
ncbi:MAG: tetrahydromethanopterin S-methyltransferase subunit B [Methanopyraceae archaeon]